MEVEIKTHISLAQHTTLKVGGVADYFAEVTSGEELKAVLHFASQNEASLYILGGGSNILFPDEGFRGVVMKNTMQGVRYQEQDGQVLLTCGAGEAWDEVVADSVQKGYWGLENLSAIPGTVGATPIQNVGAYGVEVCQLISAVTCVHADTLEEKKFTNAQCEFGYRDSYFKTPEGKKWIVTEVTFSLSLEPKPILEYKDISFLKEEKKLSPKIIRDAVIDIRSKKFPDWRTVGTAGSFFKNPTVSEEEHARLLAEFPGLVAHQTATGSWKLSLGWILDKVLGLKGYCEGGVCLFEHQALVLVSHGDSSVAVKNFYTSIQKKVFEKTEIKIEPEVQIIKNKK